MDKEMQMRERRPFTLVELLVVIAIIAVLMGMLLPAVGKVREQAKVTKAKTQMKSLQIAIKQYESTYGVLPVAATAAGTNTTVSGADYDKLIAFLSQTCTTGNDAYKAVGNTRKIKFLAVDKPGVFLDPWDQTFVVIIDSDYDGEIPNAEVRGLVEDTPASMVIWCLGPDKKSDTTPSEKVNRDNVYSVDTIWHKGTGHKLK